MWRRLLTLLFFLCRATCQKLTYPCQTPNNEMSTCLSLFSCPILMQSLGSLEPNAVQFVKDSICLGCRAGDFMVCCGTVGNYSNINSKLPKVAPITTTTTTTVRSIPQTSADEIREHREHVKNNILPSRKFCGLQHTDDRFYNESETALDEFPWLVHIKLTELEYEEEYGDRCNGVIISDRYILTDAYCGYESKVIKIGQYNTESVVSCTNNTDFDECTNPTIYARIEKKIRSGKKENGPYDFTLLRLDQKLTYSDFVRPICLPVQGSLRPPSETALTFSGWGSNGPGKVIKKRLQYDTTAEKECYDVSVGLEGNVKFAGVSLACLIPKAENTGLACNGEHGGPLMYKYKQQWFVEGIIVEAFAYKSQTNDSKYNTCSNKDPVSGIFITPTYMEWILDSIED